MADSMGFQEKTYWLIGTVGRYGILYDENVFDAKLTLDLKSQYTLTVPQGKQVDFIGITNLVQNILIKRGQKINSMILNPDGSYLIKVTTLPKERPIQDNPQA